MLLEEQLNFILPGKSNKFDGYKKTESVLDNSYSILSILFYIELG